MATEEGNHIYIYTYIWHMYICHMYVYIYNNQISTENLQKQRTCAYIYGSSAAPYDMVLLPRHMQVPRHMVWFKCRANFASAAAYGMVQVPRHMVQVPFYTHTSLSLPTATARFTLPRELLTASLTLPQHRFVWLMYA